MSLDLQAIKNRSAFLAHARTRELIRAYKDLIELVAEVERLRAWNAELIQAVRLCDEEADGIQVELQAEVERLRTLLCDIGVDHDLVYPDHDDAQ